MCVTDIHTNANRNCDSVADSYANTYTECYPNGDSDTYNYAQCYPNGHSYSYGKAHSYCQAQHNTEATPQSAAAPNAVITAQSSEFRMNSSV